MHHDEEAQMPEQANLVQKIIRRAQGGNFPPEPVAAIAGVAETAISMLSGALAAFDAGGDAVGARAAVALESQVDDQEDAVDQQVVQMIHADPDFAAPGTYLLWIVHNYERAADRATNVAEQVVYIAAGPGGTLG